MVSQSFPFYLVYTDQETESHHDGLHTNTAPFVLTFRPQAEDRIYATGSCHALEQEGTITLEAEIIRRNKRSLYGREVVKVLSDPGRSALLGEDGLEDAYGHSCVIDLLAEKIQFFPETTEHYSAAETADGKDHTEITPAHFFVEWEKWEYAPVGAESFSYEALEKEGIESAETGTFIRGEYGRLMPVA